MSDGSLPSPMKLLFVILAHDRPEDAAELARTLVGAAANARALIHFDARAAAAGFAALGEAMAGEPRIGLVEKRVACRWGAFGLVEAPLNALAQAEAEADAGGWAPDYAVLLSGACLPCRPLASLERFLGQNAGREFIESEDERWITGGWRSERWRVYHVFDHKTQNLAEMLSAMAQKRLGVRRRFPKGLEPRFGSQWWALTWPVVRAILADVRRNPKRLGFFRTVWIPDEMVFQSYVAALVPPEAIAGFGLTHFQFTNRGKPVVYHEDHAPYVRTLGRFFFRKASPEARSLRAACLACAGEPDDGADLAAIGRPQDHYRLKLQAQTHYMPPGSIFFRDQFTDQTRPVLASLADPYVVLVGPPALARRLTARLPEPPFAVLGEIFAPAAVDLGPGREALGGLRRGDVAIRDQHPALWLARVRARAREAGGVPVLLWSPTDQRRLLAFVARDPAALVVGLPAASGHPARDRAALIAASLGPERLGAARLPLGLPEAQLAAAVLDTGAPWSPDIAGWLASGVAPANAPGLRPPDLLLPWGGDPGAATGARRRAELAAGLAACRFRDAAWFPALAAALAAAYDPAWDPERDSGHDRGHGGGHGRHRVPAGAAAPASGTTTRAPTEAGPADLPEAVR